jgi:hypothetical protein
MIWETHLTNKLFTKYPEKIDYISITSCDNCHDVVEAIVFDLEFEHNRYSIAKWKNPCDRYSVPRSNGNVTYGGTIRKPSFHYYQNIDINNILVPIEWQEPTTISDYEHIQKGISNKVIAKNIPLDKFSNFNFHIPCPVISCYQNTQQNNKVIDHELLNKYKSMQEQIVTIFNKNSPCLMNILLANLRTFENEESSYLSILPTELINMIIGYYYDLD